MSSRPKEPKYARNKNILVIGGSGSGKTRFFVKPNLLQCHSSYVVTDPKGTILAAQVKGCRALFYELFRHRIEPFFNVAVLRKLCVPAKSHNHTAFPCIKPIAYKV